MMDIFNEMPFNEWLDFPKLPKMHFLSFFEIIDNPDLRKGIDVYLDEYTNRFKKVKSSEHGRNKFCRIWGSKIS